MDTNSEHEDYMYTFNECYRRFETIFSLNTVAAISVRMDRLTGALTSSLACQRR